MAVGSTMEEIRNILEMVGKINMFKIIHADLFT
jgi:hypothetical protein